MAALTPEFARRLEAGEDRERAVCTHCGFIAYENPKIVVGAVVAHEGRVLLCRRAIEPRLGFWTLPAGFMELDETPAAGAVREAREEANAEIVVDGLLALYTILHVNQVMMVFRARFQAEPEIAAGPESLDVGLFAWEDIPWSELAFPSVRWALDAWRATGAGPLGAPFGNPA